jgi:succinate dehydrogenase/fumarate reductase flavoprotein subunit
MDVTSRVITDDKQDILVLGAGLAGLVAAVEAASAGAKVTVVDKMKPMSQVADRDHVFLPGGEYNDTTRAGGGGLNRFSLEAPIEELLQRHQELGWGRVDTKLLRAYLERVDKDCRWLRDDLKMPYQGNRVKGRGSAICPFFYSVCKPKGVRLLFKTKALKLLTAGTRVIGARVRSQQGEFDFRAKAVILATGSFQGNQEMMLKYVGPDITYLPLLTGSPLNTGDGLIMAHELGAKLINLSVCHIRTTDKYLGEGPSRYLPNIYHLGIYINRNCQRFLDEGTADSDTIANAIVYQPGGEAALVFDEKARSTYPEEFDSYPRKAEVIQIARSAEELAVKMRVSPEGLKKTIAEFNTAVKDGKALELPIPKTTSAQTIDMPPYYSFYPVYPGLNHPLGGLKINTRAQVLNLEDEPIPGLYAAGSIVNWAFGKPYEVAGVKTYKGSYHAGASSGLATALVFGRMAGQYAAEDIKNC